MADAEASREKYLTALNVLAGFYDQQARNPPESLRGELPGEMQTTENALKLDRDRAKAEFDCQCAQAQIKAVLAGLGEDPAAKTAAESLTQKAVALRDARLRVADAQEMLGKALVARTQAEAAMEQERRDQEAHFRLGTAERNAAPR